MGKQRGIKLNNFHFYDQRSYFTLMLCASICMQQFILPLPFSLSLSYFFHKDLLMLPNMNRLNPLFNQIYTTHNHTFNIHKLLSPIIVICVHFSIAYCFRFYCIAIRCILYVFCEFCVLIPANGSSLRLANARIFNFILYCWQFYSQEHVLLCLCA